MKVALCFVLLSLSQWSQAVETAGADRLTGVLCELESNRPLFKFERVRSVQGDQVQVTATFSPMDLTGQVGAPALVETAVYIHRVLTQDTVHQLQTHELSKLEVRAGRGRFSHQDSTGKVSQSEEAVDSALPLLINDQLESWVQANWDSLLLEKSLAIRFAVLPRAETIGFKISKTPSQDPQITEFKMKPSSAIISLFLKPIVMSFESGGAHRLKSVKGRTLLKQSDRPGASDLDGKLVFDLP